MPQEGGTGLAKVSRDISQKFRTIFLVFWPAVSKEKGLFFGGKMSHHTRGGVMGPRHCHQMTHGGGGSKIGKKCPVLFEWPFTCI